MNKACVLITSPARGGDLFVCTTKKRPISCCKPKKTHKNKEKSNFFLKKFVFSNIVINVIDDNGEQQVTFGTGPFYLEHQYIRAANAALEEAEKKIADDSNPNGNVYAMASSVCQPLAISNGWTWNDANYINCMMTEINKYPASDEIQDKIIASLPSTELYRKNYASPLFVPTLSGFLLLITLIIVVVIFIRAFIWIILRLSLLFV